VSEKPKFARALRQLHDALVDLADDYRTVGERHATEQDVFHMAHLLAEQCRLQAQSLELHAPRYGAQLPDSDEQHLWDGFLAAVRRANAAVAGRTTVPGLLLLRDLRQLHLAIEEAAMLWLVVGQAAQALRDRELLELVTRSREEMTKQLLWITTRIKEAAPQVLAA
jgi:hypothetical protein